MQGKKGVPDSVNEPLDPNQPDTLVRGPFYKVLGKRYIDVAFRTARQMRFGSRCVGKRIVDREHCRKQPAGAVHAERDVGRL